MFFLSHVRCCSSAAAQRIMTKLGQDDHLPKSNSPYDFDPRTTFDLDIGLKKVIFCYKMYLLLQITCVSDMVSSYDSTLVGAPGILWDKESKVIKGSFTVKIWSKSGQNLFPRKHVITYLIVFWEQKLF